MEEDFPILDSKAIENIKKYKIPYKWRDKCIQELIDWNTCQSTHPYLGAVFCDDFRGIWEDCQLNRERTIIGTEGFKIIQESRRRQSY